MDKHRACLRGEIDFAVVLSVLWTIVFIKLYADALPEASTLESIYLLLADSKLFTNGLGISLLMMMFSDWYERKQRGGAVAHLKFCIAIASTVFLTLTVSLCVLSMTTTSWSHGIIEIAQNQADAQIVFMPFMPITLAIVNGLSPLQASLYQLCLSFAQHMFYVLVASMLYALTKNKILRMSMFLIFHLTGQVALSTWPRWVAFVPQSHFYLQNYGTWAPLSTPIDGGSLIGILMAMAAMALIYTIVIWTKKRWEQSYEGHS